MSNMEIFFYALIALTVFYGLSISHAICGLKKRLDRIAGHQGACWSPELNMFVIYRSDNSIITSPDGINWTLRSSPPIKRHK